MISTKKRDLKVEIMRIIAQYTVIASHIKGSVILANGELSSKVVMVESFCSICVLTFFVLSGFFMYNKEGDLLKLWKNAIVNFFKTIGVPFILAALFCIVFEDFLDTKASFLDCIRHMDFIHVLKTFFTGIVNLNVNSWPFSCAHLWFIFEYFFIVLVFPITYLILKKLDRKIVYAIVGLCAILLLANDYLMYSGNDILETTLFHYLRKPIFYSMLGSVLYNDFLIKRCKGPAGAIVNKKIFVASLGLYLVSVFTIFFVQRSYYINKSMYPYFASYESGLALISTISFICIIYNIRFTSILSIRKQKWAYYLASKMFGVYMIHFIFVHKLTTLGLQPILISKLTNPLYFILYYLLYGLAIMALSLLIIRAFDLIVGKGTKS